MHVWNILINDLAGFVTDEDECNFIAISKEKWLGVIINTTSLTFTISPEKIGKLKFSIENILNQSSVTPKIAGQLSSLHLALGPIIQLFLMNIYHDIKRRFSSRKTEVISKETEDKLKILAEKYKFL